MKHKATILFAVTLASGTAAADPVQPRTLGSGAPACGNMLGKYAKVIPCAPKVHTADAPLPMDLGRAVAKVIFDEVERIQAQVTALARESEG
jgi:hypothetical protein